MLDVGFSLGDFADWLCFGVARLLGSELSCVCGNNESLAQTMGNR